MARFPPLQIPESVVLDALERTQGKIVPAARLLDVSPAWVSKYLLRRGYIAKTVWVKRVAGL